MNLCYVWSEVGCLRCSMPKIPLTPLKAPVEWNGTYKFVYKRAQQNWVLAREREESGKRRKGKEPRPRDFWVSRGRRHLKGQIARNNKGNSTSSNWLWYTYNHNHVNLVSLWRLTEFKSLSSSCKIYEHRQKLLVKQQPLNKHSLFRISNIYEP